MAIELLNRGYAVRGTLRDMGRAENTRKVIAAQTRNAEHLTFHVAELMDAPAWDAASKAVDYVMHVASPLFPKIPKHEDEMIVPARDGALNVLKAAAGNGVRRVVMTSSVAAIQYGRKAGERSGLYHEEQWTDPHDRRDTTPYFRSKTIAEKAAWDFVAGKSGAPELTTICPGAILGPVLERDFGTSASMVVKMLDGSSPAIPRIGFDVVDVRSVADLHIRAMESPVAAGERFIGSEGFLWLHEIADILRERYPQRKIPRRIMPDWLVRMFSVVEPALKPILVDLSVARKVSNAKAQRLLGWQPKPPRDAVMACAESIIDLGLV